LCVPWASDAVQYHPGEQASQQQLPQKYGWVQLEGLHANVVGLPQICQLCGWPHWLEQHESATQLRHTAAAARSNRNAVQSRRVSPMRRTIAHVAWCGHEEECGQI
jgi:hypothetical protein